MARYKVDTDNVSEALYAIAEAFKEEGAAGRIRVDNGTGIIVDMRVDARPWGPRKMAKHMAQREAAAGQKKGT